MHQFSVACSPKWVEVGSHTGSRLHHFLSRRSNIDVRDAILYSLRDVEPDLELEAWTIPPLRPVEDDGPRCPNCGGPLVFERFHRIRPPPRVNAN